jgi:hypothetical protein
MIHVHIKWILMILFSLAYIVSLVIICREGNKSSGYGGGVADIFMLLIASVAYLIFLVIWLIIW